jgi:peptidoglycan hydrolase-like protein with peptidoglycan-binding domain
MLQCAGRNLSNATCSSVDAFGIDTEEIDVGLRDLLNSTVLALALGAGAASAEDLVMVIGNETYRSFNAVTGARTVLTTVQTFEAAGYEVIQVADATEAQMKDAIDQFERLHSDSDRVVVVLAGQFMNSGDSTWFAPTDLQSPSLANVAFDALSLSAILSFLGEKAGGAALFLADDANAVRVDASIHKGIGALDIPQGVLVVQGTPSAVRNAITDAFLQENVSLAAAAEVSDEVAVSGFVSDWVSLNGVSKPQEAEDVVVDLTVPEAIAEQAFWEASDAMGSKASYDAYLRRYPDGEFAVQAKQMLQVIADATPKYTPEEQAELNMALTRNDRRRVQEQLSLLGFNPRGIDGLFGPGSRTAIKRFQAQNGLDGGGFTNPETLRVLRTLSETRAAELAAEAEREKLRREAADAQLWAQTGARGTEADYIAYLSKYPKGLYSSAARIELERIEEENRLTAQAEERADWDFARNGDTVAEYRAFLSNYPNGVFANQAEERIRQLTQNDAEDEMLEKAKAEEASLRMSPAMRLLIERKLKAIGHKPGKQDGTFNKATRNAIQTYQNARGLPVNGYITRQTVVRLMSE